jgi:hypothetical protein
MEHVRIVLVVVLASKRLPLNDIQNLLILILCLVLTGVQTERNRQILGIIRAEHGRVDRSNRSKRSGA